MLYACSQTISCIPLLKMGLLPYLDTILVPLSFFLLFGYHGFLWNICKKKSNLTTIKINKIRRRSWVLSITEDPTDNKLMFAVQTLRNTQMVIVLTATIAIIINSSLAAYTNNAYKANHLLKDSYFGLQSSRIIVLKYGSASLFLLSGFLCNSVAIGCLSEANILAVVTSLPLGYVQGMMERGFLFTFIGNRMLYITVPLLLWLLGPIPMVLSSITMVWVLYEIDFTSCVLEQESLQSSMTRTID
ncbi:hypothetical protein AQUCO_00400511v1 [Aquilegia coerulea]|uniref:Uncharacterized protein n=1 Tax=Aquilegia coerulea TaxID=218851 RepID=A0A2G5EV96_AQUCA|nr:hypothetical protein AQUCO_00400511v1 [Aquilegia coerulea]